MASPAARAHPAARVLLELVGVVKALGGGGGAVDADVRQGLAWVVWVLRGTRAQRSLEAQG